MLPGGDNTFLPIPIDPPEREEKLVTVIAVEPVVELISSNWDN